MRKFLFGLFGCLALGAGAFAAQPAEAQPYHRGYYERPAYRPAPRPYYAPRPYRPYGYRPAYGGGYRPAYVAPPRCWVRPERVWNGYNWVRRPVRVCR